MSRGNVTLQSTDTLDLPIIHPNWLASKTNQEMTIAMFKGIRQAFQSDAMAPVVIGEEYNPGNQVQLDQDILDYIKNNRTISCRYGTPHVRARWAYQTIPWLLSTMKAKSLESMPCAWWMLVCFPSCLQDIRSQHCVSAHEMSSINQC